MSRLTDVARKLRNNSTSAERVLWRAINRNQIEGFRFRRQVPLAGYVVDFACHDAKLVIEVDGATHSTEAEIEYDRRRETAIVAEGYAIVRFRNDKVYESLDAVVDAILLKLQSLRPRIAAPESPVCPAR